MVRNIIKSKKSGHEFSLKQKTEYKQTLTEQSIRHKAININLQLRYNIGQKSLTFTPQSSDFDI